MEEYIIKKPLSSRKKRLLFVMSRFLDGGIDTVLIEYLRHIVKQQEFAITLAIGVHMDNSVTTLVYTSYICVKF